MKFFQNLSLRAKLFSGIFLIILIFLVLMFIQFNTVDRIEENQKIMASAEKCIQSTTQLATINFGEIRNLLEIIQADELNTVEAASENHNLKVKEIKSLYEQLYQEIKVIYPDASGMGRIKIINYLNESQANINNTLVPYFENAYVLKKEQFKKGDKLDPIRISADGTKSDSTGLNESPEIIRIAEQEIAGTSRSAQLIKLYRLYKQNNDQVNNQFRELNNVLSEVFQTASKSTIDLNQRIKQLNSLFFLFSLITAFIVYLGITNTIVRPLESLEKMATRLSMGELPEPSDFGSADEIGKMAGALNTLSEGLNKTSEFASEIGRSNFDSKFEPLSKQDVLGNSLLEMRKSLQLANEEEKKRKIEDQERNWTTEGMALFGEILRRHTENIGLLSRDIIQNLVKYLKANQGGIFILNDSDPENIYLELMSAYAYNREKFIQKRIQLGEGLLGGAAVEKYTIYMTDIPQEYVEIESGLGGANPKSLLIVPLKLENTVLGVIELASFNTLKKFEIELVERIGESIASTLSTAKINTRTAELLEQSRLQAQEMQEQEEEMRQNMEEMVAAQEESLRREEELRKEVAELDALRVTLADKDKKQKARLDELTKSNSSLSEENEILLSQTNKSFDLSFEAIVMIDNAKKIQFFNASAERLFDYNKSEILGRDIESLIAPEMAPGFSESINLYLQTGRKGLIDIQKEINLLNKIGEQVPALILMQELNLKGSKMIGIFIKDLGEIRNLKRENEFVSDQLMSKEFDLSTKINFLEDFIKSNGLLVPEELEAQSDMIKWNNGYSIELNIIDQQHKKWIEFINVLYKSYKSNGKKKDISENISKLLDYTDYHFGFEEKYLEDFNCGNLENHKKEHASFVSNIKKHHVLHDQGDTEAVYRLIIYLNNWVINHIKTEDKKYVECFKLNGLV